jgi:hypothetical protein
LVGTGPAPDSKEKAAKPGLHIAATDCEGGPRRLGSTLVVTALTTVISLVVRPERMPSAQSMNAMLLSLGGSLGTTLTMGVLAARGTADTGLNPLHTGPGVAFSDGLLLLAVLPVAALAISATVPRSGSGRPDGDREVTSAAGAPVRWPAGD